MVWEVGEEVVRGVRAGKWTWEVVVDILGEVICWLERVSI